MKNKIFIPHELKTLTIDAEKKIFEINGEEFGKVCTGFTITCKSYNDFDIRVEIDTTVKFVSIRDGEFAGEAEHPVRGSWYSSGEKYADN